MYWRSGTYLNNRIKHEDLTRKVNNIQFNSILAVYYYSNCSFDSDMYHSKPCV
ncbi:hypothetical protein BC833DRAFT_591118 [Globomyces pollinis-pini]|nr:hypothetical protein BC833DRAFT_591118 [Globomyces pollinis-pini]